MTDAVVVLSTCADEEEAARIAEALVTGRFAACVNILPAIQSVYYWKGNVERAREVLLIVKTTAHRFPALRESLEQLHSYETPEIIAIPIVSASEKYLAWIREQV